MASASDRIQFRPLRVEPRRLWIGYRPVAWPGAEAAWIDLARLSLGRAGDGGLGLPRPEELKRLDDLVYLPPAAPARRDLRRELARRLVDAGGSCLWQALPGETPPAGCEVVWDLTEPLVTGALDRLSAAGPVGTAVWPWVPGLTDHEALWREGLDRLRDAGAERVVPLPVELPPRELRRLAELAAVTDYAELFHRPPRPTLDFARAAHRRGLEPLWPRPVPELPRRLAVCRAVAGHLAQIGELELALAGSEVHAQVFFRAARRLEEEPRDLEALLREGNLGVLGWLEAPARAATVDYLERRRSAAFDARLARYTGEPPPN